MAKPASPLSAAGSSPCVARWDYVDLGVTGQQRCDRSHQNLSTSNASASSPSAVIQPASASTGRPACCAPAVVTAGLCVSY